MGSPVKRFFFYNGLSRDVHGDQKRFPLLSYGMEQARSRCFTRLSLHRTEEMGHHRLCQRIAHIVESRLFHTSRGSNIYPGYPQGDIPTMDRCAGRAASSLVGVSPCGYPGRGFLNYLPKNLCVNVAIKLISIKSPITASIAANAVTGLLNANWPGRKPRPWKEVTLKINASIGGRCPIAS